MQSAIDHYQVLVQETERIRKISFVKLFKTANVNYQSSLSPQLDLSHSTCRLDNLETKLTHVAPFLSLQLVTCGKKTTRNMSKNNCSKNHVISDSTKDAPLIAYFGFFSNLFQHRCFLGKHFRLIVLGERDLLLSFHWIRHTLQQ